MRLHAFIDALIVILLASLLLKAAYDSRGRCGGRRPPCDDLEGEFQAELVKRGIDRPP